MILWFFHETNCAVSRKEYVWHIDSFHFVDYHRKKGEFHENCLSGYGVKKRWDSWNYHLKYDNAAVEMQMEKPAVCL